MTNSERRFLERGNSASSTPPTDLAMHRQRAGLVEALRRNDPTRQSQEVGEQSSHGDKPHSLREPLSSEDKIWLRQQTKETKEWFFQQTSEIQKWLFTLKDKYTVEVVRKQDPEIIDQQVKISEYLRILEEKHKKNVSIYNDRIEQFGYSMQDFINSGTREEKVKISSNLYSEQKSLCNDLESEIAKLDKRQALRERKVYKEKLAEAQQIDAEIKLLREMKKEGIFKEPGRPIQFIRDFIQRKSLDDSSIKSLEARTIACIEEQAHVRSKIAKLKYFRDSNEASREKALKVIDELYEKYGLETITINVSGSKYDSLEEYHNIISSCQTRYTDELQKIKDNDQKIKNETKDNKKRKFATLKETAINNAITYLGKVMNYTNDLKEMIDEQVNEISRSEFVKNLDNEPKAISQGIEHHLKEIEAYNEHAKALCKEKLESQ